MHSFSVNAHPHNRCFLANNITFCTGISPIIINNYERYFLYVLTFFAEETTSKLVPTRPAPTRPAPRAPSFKSPNTCRNAPEPEPTSVAQKAAMFQTPAGHMAPVAVIPPTLKNSTEPQYR